MREREVERECVWQAHMLILLVWPVLVDKDVEDSWEKREGGVREVGIAGSERCRQIGRLQSGFVN